MGPESTRVEDSFYDGPDPVSHLMMTLDKWATSTLENLTTINNPPQLTFRESLLHFVSTRCSLCFREFSKKNKKVSTKEKMRLQTYFNFGICIFGLAPSSS